MKTTKKYLNILLILVITIACTICSLTPGLFNRSKIVKFDQGAFAESLDNETVSSLNISSESQDKFDDFLRTPSNICLVSIDEDEYMLVNDSEINVLKLYKLKDNKSTTPSAFLKINVIDMVVCDNKVYVLIKNNNSKSFGTVNVTAESLEFTEISTSNVNLTNVSSISIIKDGTNSILHLLSNIDSSISVIIYDDNYEITESKSISPSLNITPNLENGVKKIIALNTTTILCMYETKIVKIVDGGANNYTSSIIVDNKNKIIDAYTSNTNLFFIDEADIYKINDVSQENPVSTVLKQETGATNLIFNNNIIYYSHPVNNEVCGIDISSETPVNFISISNKEIIPTILLAKDIFTARLKNDSYLQILPYTNANATQLKSGQDVVILSTDDTFFTHYYCLFAGSEQNAYGYILKSDLELTEETATNKTVKTFANETDILSYPAPITDSKNKVIKTLPAMTTITEISTLDYKSESGSTYSRVKLSDDSIGFVESKRLAEVTGKKTEMEKTNAKVYKDAKLYLNSDGTEEILTIPRGTRVCIEDDQIDRNLKYTKIYYNTSSGEQIVGYVETETLIPDSLTAIQIVGIVLIVINIIVLITIFVLNSKRKK